MIDPKDADLVRSPKLESFLEEDLRGVINTHSELQWNGKIGH
jgi:hypothetical protein